MDFDTLPWVLMILAYLFLMFKHGQDFLFNRKYKTVLCHYEWCGFGALAPRDDSQLAYNAMNHHLQQEHGSGPWANAVLNSSD